MRIQHTTQNLNSFKGAICGNILNGRGLIANNAAGNAAGNVASEVVGDIAGKKPLTAMEKFYQSEGLKKFLTSEKFGKILDLSVKNPVILTSVYSLFLCTLLRPATIMALPGKNVDDKKYASAHSIASGIIGLAVTAAILTPVGHRVKRVFKNPQRYLKPETVKRMYPNVRTRECIDRATGEKVEKVVVALDGKMLQNEKFEKLRLQEIEELKKNGTWDKMLGWQQKNMSKRNPYVCQSNEPVLLDEDIIRSSFHKKANGEYVALQANGTPVIDELKISDRKNKNAEQLLKMVPDLLVAAPRAAITVATIPFILTKVFGLQKSSAKAKPEETNQVSFNSNQAGLKSFDYTQLFPGLKKEVQ